MDRFDDRPVPFVGGDDEPLTEQVGPDPRLLIALVALLVLGMVWMFLGREDAADRRVVLGSIEDVAQRASAGPVPLAELPHLVLMRTSTGDPVYDASWGEATGRLLLSPTEQLVVLETTDPTDGAPLAWCPARGVFEHPDGDRLYAPDGRLVRGDGRRGMDRRSLGLTGPALLEVDDGRWVSGIPRDVTDTAFEVRGAPCID